MWGYLVCICLGAVASRIHQRWDEISQIYDNVHQREPSVFSSALKTARTVLKLQYDKIHHHYVRKVKEPFYHTHQVFDVDYYHLGKNYKIRIFDNSRDKPMVNFNCPNGKDVTDKVLMFAGPGYDFHGITYTPNDLGFDYLILLDEGFQQRRINGDDQITFE